MTSRERMKRKAVEDVLDAEQSFKDADSTTGVFECDTYKLAFKAHLLSIIPVACPNCDNDRAYYYQLQIRSADEPMTTCE